MVYTALTALGVGVLLRARGWIRALGALPLAATSAHHMLTNYAAAHPIDRDAASLVDTFEAMLWVVPLACLAVAMAVDLRQLRRGKSVVPGVLLYAERAGGSGLTALASYGAWCVPWSTLIALRFARLRRSLLYGVTGRAPYPGAEILHRTVAWSVAQIDASDREHAWRGVGLRDVVTAGRGMRDWRRKWFVLISLGLMVPAVALLGVGSFPAAAEIQERFASGNGPYILVGFGIAGLLWTGWQLVLLLRAWRATLASPHGEVLATIRLRVWTAAGGCVTGVLLLLRLRDGVGPGDPVIRNLHLLEALNNFLAYLGFALLLIALTALIPPGGGLGLALAGARVGAGVITQEAAVHAAVYGALGVVLMAAAGNASSPDSSSRQQGEDASKSADEDQQNLTFEPSPKHGQAQRGNTAPEPANPQSTLEDSITFNPNTTRRVGVDKGRGIRRIRRNAQWDRHISWSCPEVERTESADAECPAEGRPRDGQRQD
ncbi:hypothetical protein ABZS71_02020 [Streptomyces sp. NPDC005393]|uniref:hypothetical protein n=1 Tax=Streptomyces sp. NPDC005393 TaxID=3157041 RepID=UPI0033ADE757